MADLAVSKRARTITGFIFVIAGLLSSIATATIDGNAAGLTGRFGIWSAKLLFALFGKAAYLFGPFLIWSGLRGIVRDEWPAYLSGLIGNLSLLWSLSVFFHLAGGTESGIAGEQFGLLLEFFTGRTGAYTINGLLFFAGVLLLLQIPFDQVKDRVINLLEGRPSDFDPSLWLRRTVYLLPVIAMGYSLYNRFRNSRKEQAGNVQSDKSGASVSDEANRGSTEADQAISGGSSVFRRFFSDERPPWIQKVVVSESEVDELEEISEAAAHDSQTLQQKIEPEAMKEDRTIEIPAPRMTAGNRWRPGYGFDSIEKDEDNPESGDAEPASDGLLSDGLMIEEVRVSGASGREDYRKDRSHARTHPRIIYDPAKNRYLFRQTPEERSVASPHSRVELLDRMDLDMLHAPRILTENERIHVADDFEPMSSPASEMSVDEEDGLREDELRTEHLPPTFEDNLIKSSEDPGPANTSAFSAASDEPEDADSTWDGIQPEKKAVSSPDGNPAERVGVSTFDAPEKMSGQPSRLPSVVLSESRFSRYQISRRIVRRTPQLQAEDPEAEIRENWHRLDKVLNDYGIQAKVVGAIRGPMITMFEVLPEPGIRVNRILGIQDEIRMHLAALSVRILAPIPGKSTIGIELPNRNRQYVSMGDLINGDPEFTSGRRELTIALGKDITGTNRYLDLTRLPHLLIAGATGSGKSVFMNSVIGSLLFNHSPDEVRFLMIDPKMVELKLFEGIPHLLYPVITDVRLADRALSWAVQEMEARYQLLSSVKCRDIRSYNERVRSAALPGKLMPYIVILIDELSDLMMVSAKEVEDSIIRLTQKARAVGIHVIMATQRPSVDVITALIKANCPARISFQVASRTDSRVILDVNGAEALLGRGDMLYKSPTAADPVRLQSPMISEEEIEQLVAEAVRYGQPRFIELPGRSGDEDGGEESAVDVDQALLDAAWEIIRESGKTSTSYVQRRLRIGYNRAATIVEKLEQMGYLGPAIGNRPREILKRH